MIGVDSIASPLRYFIVSQYVLRHYRPTEQPGYLEPAEPDFRGLPVIPEDLNGPLRCGRLPLRWGESRLPLLGLRSEQSTALTNWTPTVATQSAVTLTNGATGWRHRGAIDSRAINYLLVSLAARVADRGIGFQPVMVRAAQDALLTIRFASANIGDPVSEATLVLIADGQPHAYLVPIGCSPAWTWRFEISTLELLASPGCVVDHPQVTAWSINEFD